MSRAIFYKLRIERGGIMTKSGQINKKQSTNMIVSGLLAEAYIN